MEKEFLLWSPGVLRSCGTHLLVLACAIALGAQSVELTERAQTLFDAAAHTLLWRARGLGLWSALGLLGSSCCAIQVVLHLFSFHPSVSCHNRFLHRFCRCVLRCSDYG